MDADEERKARQRERTRKYREKLRAAGINPHTRNDEQRAAAAARAARYRDEAHQRGERLPSETWWQRNRERHRENVSRYRAENVETQMEAQRQAQARRRSTPWGRINNSLIVILHYGVRANSHRQGKYAKAVGYTWATLRAHIEAQFTPDMTWENWGDVWELDHIKPLSSFQYESLGDPLFRECWALSNLRPLLRHENMAKGAKHPPDQEHP